MFVFVCHALLCVHSSFATILKRKRKPVVLLAFIILQMYCYYKCSVALPHGAVGWSAVCDCGISRYVHDHTDLLFAIWIHCSRNTGIPISGRSLVCHVLNVGLVWRNNTLFFLSNPYEI